MEVFLQGPECVCLTVQAGLFVWMYVLVLLRKQWKSMPVCILCATEPDMEAVWFKVNILDHFLKLLFTSYKKHVLGPGCYSYMLACSTLFHPHTHPHTCWPFFIIPLPQLTAACSFTGVVSARRLYRSCSAAAPHTKHDKWERPLPHYLNCNHCVGW